jgi:3'-5' exoribonuclease
LKKGIYISAIRPATSVEGLFCVSSKRMLETRNGEPYLAITLTDRTGEIEGRVWEGAKQLDTVFSKGDYVRIRGEAQKFREATQLKITHLELIGDDKVDPGLFLPVTQADTDELWSEFRKYIRGIKSDVLVSLLNGIFKDRKISEAFKLAPAGKRMHHAYIGGLLEHSVSVTRLANSVCRLYPYLDRDLLVSAALIHDIGKIDEFTFSRPPIDYSDRGRLLGHVVLGISIIDSFVARLGIKDSSQQIVTLKHLVLSHHGQREFGAPVVPMMEEAIALNYIDDLDAKLNYLGGLKKDISGATYGWTEYQRLFERHFYLQGQDEAVEDKALKEATDLSRLKTEDIDVKDRPETQPNLWSKKKTV